MDELRMDFEDQMQEIEIMQGNHEDNILETHKNLGGFIQKKIQNLRESYEVFMETFNNFDFPCKFLRMNHLRQYEAQLPIYSKKKEFLDAYMQSNVIIFKSNAGSGKSTQLPQYLLEVCRKRILVTEPRALAADSLARRVNDVSPTPSHRNFAWSMHHTESLAPSPGRNTTLMKIRRSCI
jgi:HrpA-like RNA helicase